MGFALTNDNRLISVILGVIAVRPLIDLMGSYDSAAAINTGGVIGLFFFLFLSVRYILKHIEGPHFNRIAISFLLIGLLYIINLVSDLNNNQNYVATARFFVGFSPLLMLPYFSAKQNHAYKSLIFFTKLFLIIIFLPIIIAWLQNFGLYEFSYYDYDSFGRIGRPSGGYFHPSALGRILIFSTLFIYFLSLKDIISIKTKYLSLAILFSSTLISSHRTSIIIAFSIIFFIEYINTLSKRIFFIYSSIICASATLFYIAIYHNRKFNLLLEGFSFQNGDLFRGRLGIWGYFINYFEQLPFWAKSLGIGHETFEPHNDWLRTVMTIGIVGLIIQILLFFFIYRYLRSCLDHQYYYLLNILFFIFLVFGITLQPSAYPNFMWLFSLSCYILISFFNKKSPAPVLAEGQYLQK
jgi:hypothetical protein